MNNINYLERFFKKHHLSGQIVVDYDDNPNLDDDMTYITFEDGTRIHISDVIFDIESELDRGLAEEWMKEKKENDVPFYDWFLSHSNYIPKDTDTSSLDKYQKDMEDVVKEVSDAIDQVFEFKIGTTDDEDE